MKFDLLKQIGIVITAGALTVGIVNAAEVQSDGVRMKDGKVQLIKGANISEVLQVTTLADGTIIMPDGNVTMPDGKRITLSEGQNVSLSGKVHTSPGAPETAPNKP